MHDLAEQVLAPVRQRAVAKGAPLLERLGVTPEQLEQALSPLQWCGDPEARRLGRAAARLAVRDATRF